MKTVLFCFVLFCFITKGFSQRQDYYWVLGQNASLKFNNSAPKITFEKGSFDCILVSNSSLICNKSNGFIDIFTNGNVIFNQLGVPMENGDSLNSGFYGIQKYPTDAVGIGGSIVLPFPNHEDSFFVFYTNLQYINGGMYLPDRLLYSLVNLKANNGLGKVVVKDYILNQSNFEWGRINAIQHANGRDWWILLNGFQDMKHYIFLLEPSGIKLNSIQTLGSLYNKSTPHEYQSCVNQSGNQIAYLYSTQDTDHQHRVDLYDFDRCSGLLYNYKIINIIDSFELLGCSFSPNDSLLYINTLFKLMQLNIKDTLDTNKILIARWNNINDPFPTRFALQKISPLKNIFISVNGSSRQIHCITKPNLRGQFCQFVQGYIRSDSSNQYFNGALPNIPNFRLGVLKGSECDTIREAQPPTVSDGLLIYPNPCRDELMVNSYLLLGNTTVEIFDVLGRKINSFNLSNGNGITTIDVKHLTAALYLLKITNTNGKMKTVKFVKQ